ncbi:MAG: archease [candidate division WOR-3 bacterium]
MIEFIEHTADIGIIIRASSLNEVFEKAGYGMFKIICENLEEVECKEIIEGEIIAENLIDMLYLFLEKLLFEFDTKAIILKCFDVIIENNKLTYKAKGEIYNSKKHKIGTGIKSPTYHKMEIKNENGGFIAFIIFDV